MGNGPSEPVHAVDDKPVGLRVLGVQKGGPATMCTDTEFVSIPSALSDAEHARILRQCSSLTNFFDIILAANGERLDEDGPRFGEIVRDCKKEGKAVQLEVWSTKLKVLRTTRVRPRSWEGLGSLGMFVSFGSYRETCERALHVTAVAPHSPAELAGLVALDDYILGSLEAPDGYEGVEDFRCEIDKAAGDEISLFVYSAGTDCVRQVDLFLPIARWGPHGEGSGLGCAVATGALHNLPEVLSLGGNEWSKDRDKGGMKVL